MNELFQMPPGICAPVQTLQLYSRDNHLPQTQSKLVIIFLHSVPDRKLSSTSKFWRVAAISDLSNKSCFHLDLYLRHQTQLRTVAGRSRPGHNLPLWETENIELENFAVMWLQCRQGPPARGWAAWNLATPLTSTLRMSIKLSRWLGLN